MNKRATDPEELNPSVFRPDYTLFFKIIGVTLGLVLTMLTWWMAVVWGYTQQNKDEVSKVALNLAVLTETTSQLKSSVEDVRFNQRDQTQKMNQLLIAVKS